MIKESLHVKPHVWGQSSDTATTTIPSISCSRYLLLATISLTLCGPTTWLISGVPRWCWWRRFCHLYEINKLLYFWIGTYNDLARIKYCASDIKKRKNSFPYYSILFPCKQLLLFRQSRTTNYSQLLQSKYLWNEENSYILLQLIQLY